MRAMQFIRQWLGPHLGLAHQRYRIVKAALDHWRETIHVFWKLGSDPLLWARTQRNFSLTLDPKYLDSALTRYFECRSQLFESTSGSPKSVELNVSGWLDSTRKSLLPKNGEVLDGGLLVKRVRKGRFRLGPFYNSGNMRLICTGFKVSFSVNQETLEKSYSKGSLGEVLDGIGFLVESEFSNEIFCGEPGTLTNGGIEEIWTRSSGWWSGSVGLKILLMMPNTFLWLIEAANDVNFAQFLLASISRFRVETVGRISPATMMRLQLVAKSTEMNLPLPKGWERMAVVNPNWRATAKSALTGSPLPEGSATLYNVRLFHGGTVIEKGGLFLNDETQQPWFDFVAGRSGHVIGSITDMTHAFVRIPPANNEIRSIKTGILLSGRADFNWFHWLIEYMPRLLQLEDSLPLSIPVIVSRGMPKTALEALSQITDREIIEVDRSKTLEIKKLIVPRICAFQPDSAFYWLADSSYFINLDRLREIRCRVLASHPEEDLQFGKVIFVRNSASRGLVNQRRVVRHFVSRGYLAVDPATLSFEEQVKVMHSAEKLVIVGGAVMSNLIFAKTDARVAVLSSVMTEEYKMPQILASIAGAKVRNFPGPILGRAARQSLVQLVHSDFFITLATLRAAARFLGEV